MGFVHIKLIPLLMPLECFVVIEDFAYGGLLLHFHKIKLYLDRRFYQYKSGPLKSSPSQMFFKIGVLKNFTIFTGKHLCWSLVLIKLQVSCEYWVIFKDRFFFRTSPVAASVLFFPHLDLHCKRSKKKGKKK